MNTPIYSGIITNYVCTAACRHCMFASSYNLPKEYISREMAEKLARLLRKSGTYSVHIGGGEPFMNFEALTTLITCLNEQGIGVDYIETNAFWCKDEKFTRDRLMQLRALGVETVMVSVDPFHIEYVPLERPILLCKLLRECGFDYFVWKERYLRMLSKLDRTRTYSHQELKALLGDDYVTETAREYGVGMNGRALRMAEAIYPRRPAEYWLTSKPCDSIRDTGHCHLDLYGNIVPPGCPGLSAAAEDYLNEDFSISRYPVFGRLASGGTEALFGYAKEKGFIPDPKGYPTRCSLCFAMRAFLLEKAPSADLSPRCFYQGMTC